MPLPEGLHLRTADADDLPSVAMLRESVGWAVQDWALRAVLQPPHARCLVAVDGADQVVGTGSGISYGALGVVGNMIVDPAHRRRGIGAAILEAVIAFLDERGCSRLELSATDQGRPLYARYGFALTDPGLSALVPRDAALGRPATTELAEAKPASIDELAAYDAPRFGGDRRPLITTMLADPNRQVILARDADALVGWAWVRPESERVGPLLANSPDIATALMGEAMRRLPGSGAVRLNFPSANRVGASRLRELGAALEPWGGRMARGPQVQRREDTIYANAVGALG